MPTTHIVQEGDCIASIAFKAGLRPNTVWEDPGNASLREKRSSPHLLEPGDCVVVPDLLEKTHDAASEKRHRFRRKSVPEKLRLKLMAFNSPRAGLSYRLEVGSHIFTGKTDQDGMLEAPIPPDLESGLLILDDREAYAIQIHTLRPGDGVAGARQRLSNLGFIPHPEVEEEALRSGVILFQNTYGTLTTTGELDEPTLKALIQMHGS